jgi:predicted outer membrane repeat protein
MSENETDSDEKNRFYDSIHDDMEHDLDGEEQGSQQSTNSSSKTTLLSSLTSSTSPSDSSTSPSVGTEAFRVILTHNTFYFNFAIGAEGSMTGGDATGAALYFEGLNISIYGGEFLGNSAIGGNTTVTTAAMGGNTGGYARGGGVFIHRHTRQVSIQSTMFELNSAEGGIGSLEPNPYIPSVYGRGGMAFGGAIAAWTALSLAEQHFTVRFCQFFDNDAIGGHAYLNAGQGMGGAIWGSRVNLDNTRFFANFAANGGAIYTLDLKADQNTFAYNDAKATTQEPALGGAIFAFTALISNSSFLGNVAKTQFAHGDALGGAIHSEESLRVESCDFRFNKALTRYTQALGGAVAGYAHTELFNCSFIENGALSASELGTGCGGSIYLDLTGFNSSVESLTIMSSNASYGGGMYIRGIGARYMHWKDVTVVGNLAFIAGGGVAFLPNRWDGGIIKSLCSTCKVHGNNAWYYGIDLIATYMSIVGTTSAVVNPGLPFEANFSILDYAENTVKDIGVVMVLSAPSETMFQSGAAQNTKYLDPFDGTIEWNDMTIWGPPGERFSLNFTLDHYMADFGANHVWIRLQVEYVLEGCPPGFRMENTSSYPACQLCLAGLYGFHSDCLPCPGDASCVLQEELIDPSVYTLLPGFAPSPRINPVAVLKCPFSYGGDKNGQPLSSCLPSVCITNCGQDRHLDSNATSTCPAPLANCTTDCADHACAQGHTGFLCTQCVCNNYPEECYYPADEQCHKCHYNLKPTLIVFGIAILCFILLKGNLLLIVMGVLSIVAIFLLGFNLISPLIPGMFGTAFIIFAEAKRGSSSGLVKSFVFFVQTVSVYITPDVFPPQLSKLVQLRSLTQFRVTGLECLNSSLFGDPFKRFIFSMVFPLTLLLLVVILYWLCELLRSIRIFRMLQDFDPFMHIPFCRSRLMALRRPEYSLLQRSESEVALVGDSYLSDSVGVGGSAVPSLMADTTDSGDSPLGTSLFGGDDNASHAGSSSDKKERYLKRMNAELGRVSLFLIFAAHFELCTRVLEVFAPCIHVPSEGFWYSSTMPWLVCRDPSKQIGYFSANTVHGKMAIAGLLFGALYVLGVPAAFASLLYWRRVEIKAGDLATAQWLGLLYNSYRPSLHYFELAWILRRICIAAAISMIPFTFVSRFLIPIVILFLSLLAQRRYKPFLSKQDNNMEVISLLTIVFSIAANAIISSRPTASDVVVWKWLNFLIVSLTLLAFLYKLFKPFFKFLRSPRD